MKKGIKGKPRSEATKKKISASMKLLASWNDGSEKAKKRLEQVRVMGKKNVGNKSEWLKPYRFKVGKDNPAWGGGEKHPAWKGGCVKPNDKPRHTKEYKLWRLAVSTRDNYKCIWCESTIRLEADHIKPWKDYPELRFAIDNGRTLCHECHKTTNTYGFRANYCT